MRRGVCAVLAALSAAGCSITSPVAVIASNGEVFRGEATATVVGGTFKASNGRASCEGTFDSTTPTATVSFAIVCTDGRRGIGRALRDTSMSGSGTITMSDGSTARFVFGETAKGF